MTPPTDEARATRISSTDWAARRRAISGTLRPHSAAEIGAAVQRDAQARDLVNDAAAYDRRVLLNVIAVLLTKVPR